MEFDKGMASVLIIVMSLIASIGIGVVTNIEDQEIEKESAEYLADITGAFKTNKEQSYLEYNPASNYNGYTNLTTQVGFPVDLTTTEIVNNYPINYTGAITTISDVDPTELDLDNDFKNEYTGSDNYRFQTRTVAGGTSKYHYDYPHAYLSSGEYQNRNTDFRLIRLDRVLDKYVHDADPGVSEITLAYSQTLRQITIPIWGSELPPEVNSYYFDNNIFIIPSSRVYHYTQYLMASPLLEVDLPADVNTTYNWLCTCYITDTGYSVTLTVNNSTNYTGNADSLYLCASNDLTIDVKAYSSSGLTPPEIVTDGFTSKCDMDVTLKFETIKRYMDTRYGVGIRNAETVEWSNNENNGLIDLVFNSPSPTGTYSTTAVLNYSESNTDTLTVTRGSGMMSVTLNGRSTNIGTWESILIRIDSVHKEVTVIPISDFANFNTYSLSDIPTVLEKPDPTSSTGKTNKVLNGQGDIIKITWTADNSLKLQVDRTMVFLNSYGVIMIDPEITVSNLWPIYDKFMVHFHDVATIGSRITLGNTTYDVEDYIIKIPQTKVDPETNEVIHYDALIDVTDMKLTYTRNVSEDDQVSWTLKIESSKDSATVTTPSTFMKYWGTWYFQTGFYEIVNKISHERTWNPVGIGEDITQVLFFMLVALLIGTIIMHKLGHLGGLDILILIGAGVILIVLIGGT